MLLDKYSIGKLGLIHGNATDKEPASVPLTIGTIITDDGEINQGSVFIPPQGMVLAVSREVFNMKGKSVLGYTTVKNALSRVGIWALNIGIVDSDWQKPIASVMINFGKQPYELTVGQEFLRMTFHGYGNATAQPVLRGNEPSPEEVKEIYEKYVAERKVEFRAMMDNTFLMLGKSEEKIERNLKKSILQQVGYVAWVITGISAIMGFSAFIIGRLTTDDKAREYYEKVIVKENEDLVKDKGDLRSIDSVNFKLNSLSKEVETLTNSVKALQKPSPPTKDNH